MVEALAIPRQFYTKMIRRMGKGSNGQLWLGKKKKKPHSRIVVKNSKDASQGGGKTSQRSATLSDHDRNIIVVVSKKLPLLEVNANEAQAALLEDQFASTFGCHSFCLEGDSLTMILAINKVSLFTNWSFTPIIGDIHSQLHGFSTWIAVKTSYSANFKAH